MAKKTEAQRDRERRAEFDLPPPVVQPVEGSAQVELKNRQAKHRVIAQTQRRLAEAAEHGDVDGKKPGLVATIGLGRMATSIKTRR